MIKSVVAAVASSDKAFATSSPPALFRITVLTLAPRSNVPFTSSRLTFMLVAETAASVTLAEAMSDKETEARFLAVKETAPSTPSSVRLFTLSPAARLTPVAPEMVMPSRSAQLFTLSFTEA